MFENTLVNGAKDLLALLGNSSLLKKAYLAGGTATALQLGHRISVDFDFFTSDEFEPRLIAEGLGRLGDFQAEQVGKGTVLGTLNNIKFSLFSYPYPLIHPRKTFLSVDLAALRDIAAMKIDAIASRGARRDFIDLYFICKNQSSLSEALHDYEAKYAKLKSNLVHIKKSLVYFEEAEEDEMPQMLQPTDWSEVKRFF